jgi:hypothetical protein
MRHLAVFALVGCLASLGIARAETNPAPKGPTDKAISGDFTPDRVKADQEAFAKKLQESGKGPLPRGRNYYFAWGSMTPAEFEALGRHTVFLIVVWTQKPEELPVKLVHIRTATQDVPVTKVSSWKTPVDSGSITAKMYGPHREDGFYLVPGSAMLRSGQMRVELSANGAGWTLLELPSAVATAAANRFPNPDPAPNAKPTLKALQAFIRRKFSGFPVPVTLP